MKSRSALSFLNLQVPVVILMSAAQCFYYLTTKLTTLIDVNTQYLCLWRSQCQYFFFCTSMDLLGFQEKQLPMGSCQIYKSRTFETSNRHRFKKNREVLKYSKGFLPSPLPLITNKLQQNKEQKPQKKNTIFLLHPENLLTPYISRGLGDRRGIAVSATAYPISPCLLPSSLLSLSFDAFPVHSVVLSSHLLLCLHLFLFPCTVPCRIVLASAAKLVTCLHYLSFGFSCYGQKVFLT